MQVQKEIETISESFQYIPSELEIETVKKEFLNYLQLLLNTKTISDNDYLYYKCRTLENCSQFIKSLFGEIT
jgi:hypothetical protein